MLKNLTLLADNKKPQWLAPSSQSRCLGIFLLKTIGLEMLCLVFQQTENLFTRLPDFLAFVESDILPMLKTTLSQKIKDQPVGMRTFKCAYLIINNLHIGYDYLIFFISYADNPTLIWQKQLSLEIITNFLANTYLVRSLALTRDTSIVNNTNRSVLFPVLNFRNSWI